LSTCEPDIKEVIQVLKIMIRYCKQNKNEIKVLFDMLEIGIDGRVNQETSAAEAIAAQLNYRMEIDEYTAIGIGVANLGDRARNGWEDYYAVLTHDLDLLRLHAGGSLQRDNRGLFGGVDKTFSLWNRELVVRADVKQINDGHDVLSSIGFLYDVGNSLLLEVWGSHSDQPDLDDDDFLTIKLDYVIAF
ncbi:MAG: hypothetical protein QF773_09270, partial [Lentisphaeria bacterium]|nr:hypothetical protein [Lentisphaeria bacterium]